MFENYFWNLHSWISLESLPHPALNSRYCVAADCRMPAYMMFHGREIVFMLISEGFCNGYMIQKYLIVLYRRYMKSLKYINLCEI